MNNKDTKALTHEEKEVLITFLDFMFENESTLKNIYNKINITKNVYYNKKNNNKSSILID